MSECGGLTAESIRLDPSGLTKPLIDQMGKWARRLKIFPSGRDTWFVPEDKRAELLARHAGRRGG